MGGFLEFDAPTVWHGLALEEWALDRPDPDPWILLWRCPASLVCGKHQVPQREADLSVPGLAHARRVSGGGTVVQDEGCWSLAVVQARDTYRVDDIYDYFSNCIRSAGVDGVKRDGQNVVVGDRKVSGHAFCYRRNHVLHHGTFLVEADLERLRTALRPPPVNWETHAVDSQPAPVCNLADSGVDMEHMRHAIRERSLDRWKLMPEEPASYPDSVRAIRSWERVYGGTPRFTAHHENRSWTVRHGIVEGDGPGSGMRFTANGLENRIGKDEMPPGSWLFPDGVPPSG